MHIRVTNITSELSPAGEFLDLGPVYSNFLLRAGASWQGEVGDYVPQLFIDWAAKGKVRVVSAQSGDPLYGPISDLTPKTIAPFRELSPAEDDPFGEETPDMDEAVEANLRTQATGGHMPSTQQIDQPKIRVSLGTTQNSTQKLYDGSLSPIPGDRPRSIDDSEKFTVKAPNYHSVGSVVGKN